MDAQRVHTFRVDSADDYATGAAILRNCYSKVGSTAAESTVFDDGAKDVLTGTSGLDWYFANLAGTGVLDKNTDLTDNAFANDLSFAQAS